MSCGFPAPSLPLHSHLIPGSLQFPPERLLCRWCLSNNSRCPSRAKGICQRRVAAAGPGCAGTPAPRRGPRPGSSGSRGARCSGPTTGTADTRCSAEMQRGARRRRQLLAFRLCQSNKFCISTKQCTLQMMQCL